MAKKIFYGDDARRRLLGGAEMLYNAVKVTMSPKGGNVVVGRMYGGPTVTHDGVSVAKSIELPETDDDTLGYKVGAELIKDAAGKMNDEVGDGTTTITVLTYNLLNEANRLIMGGYNPMDIKRSLDRASETALNELESFTMPLKGNEAKLAEVTTISAGDAEIGKVVAEVVNKVGSDGVVTVEEGQTRNIEYEMHEGYRFERGYLTPYMINDFNRLESVFERPAIIISDSPMNSIAEVLPLINKCIEAQAYSGIVLIAPDINGDMPQNLVLNNRQPSGIKNVAIKAPSFGENQKKILEDIATLVGGKVVSPDKGMKYATVDTDVIGTAAKIIVDANATTIIGGAGAGEDVATRVETLRKELDKLTDEYEKEKIQKRIGALEGRVAVVRVGGATETEIEEKRFRVDDAVAAAKAALDGGIVAGGGVTLVNLAGKLTGEDVGTRLLKSALEAPFKIIMTNAGLSADEWLPKVREAKAGQGINVMKDTKLVDLIKDGVADPAKVTREAIRNAVSLAGTAITMGALVVEIPEKIDENDKGMPV